MQLMNYTNRTNVENILGQTFPAIGTTEFNLYLKASERYINNLLGYNAETTTSGILTEQISNEKSVGKIDAYGNLVVDIMHGPVHFDSYFNPLISSMKFNVGSVVVPLMLVPSGDTPTSVPYFSQSSLNTVIDVAENRKKLYYPQLYFFPAVSTVTPTAKVNLMGLQDIKFFVTVSYIGGYDEVPEDITMAASYLCAEFVMHRNNPMFLQSFSQGSMSQSFSGKANGARGGLRLGENFHIADALLQPYIRYTF